VRSLRNAAGLFSGLLRRTISEKAQQQMKILTIILRTLLGLMFVVFGSNAFLHFIPMQPMSGPAGDFIMAMAKTGYLYAIGACQVIGGALLLSGSYVPLGLTILGPIVVNIVLFHLFLEPSGLGVAAVVAAIWLFLLWRYRSAFAGIFQSRTDG